MSTKIDLLNTDRIAKDGQIANLLSANRQLSDAMQRQGAAQSMGRGQNDVRLIDMKAMSPKKCDGKLDSPFRGWAKAVRAYCNASKPGYRKYLQWVENQTQPIDSSLLAGFQ